MGPYLVAIVVSCLDPAVIVLGIVLGNLIHRDRWAGVGVVAAFAALGLVLLAAYSQPETALYWGSAHIFALAAVTGLTLWICRMRAADRAAQ